MGELMGEMERVFREFNWSGTSIGPPERWPESWRNAARIALDSSIPVAIGLGAELIYLYNDAFVPLGGPTRHPTALGQPVRVVWKEIWADILRPRLFRTLDTGLPTGEANLMMPLLRSGYLEETYISFSFAALRDDDSRPSGIFCVATDNTELVVAQRQMDCLRRFAARSALAASPGAVCELAAGALEEQARDVPFALFYLLEPGGNRARLIRSCGLRELPEAVPRSLPPTSAEPWGLASITDLSSPVLIHGVHLQIGNALSRPDLIPHHALVLPIANAAGDGLAALMIAGLNPMRPIEESRAFHLLVGQQLETAIANACAKQHAERRAEELAELNRAKTVFLSNVSHELRTPLTLVLSPIEQLRTSSRLQKADREQLDIARRGALRLLKLIDSLLRFSQAEEKRIDARYRPTDLALLTADLSSMFRSIFEQAGIAFSVDCPSLGEAVYVDPEMWERIVLNLISNAFKFTISGEVRIGLRLSGDAVELEVSDTGCGIAEKDLPHLFERFFRGEAGHARSVEGTGIGLSLVQELVQAHQGRISAKSSVGVGTTITVRIPRDKSHLPADRISTTGAPTAVKAAALPYVEEAVSWLYDPTTETDAPTSSDEILVVDDNKDMRAHLSRLLKKRWRVSTASEGFSALKRIRTHAPDLVIADIMMPGLDGFGLLNELRKNAATADIPVILLSARAGEEVSSQGLKAGAADYIVKPFSARDLIARTELQLARARTKVHARKARESAEEAGRARDEFFAALSHELRTPLASLQTWIELLKSGRLPEGDVFDALEALETSSRSLNGLVQDLLDYSAVVRGEFSVEPRPTASALPIVLAVVHAFQPVARMKDLALECESQDSCGPVRVDPLRLQQVMWNLISNAVRHTPPQGRIDVTLCIADRSLKIVVRDTGVGIEADDLPHIFGRYWRGKHAGAACRGLGLGLAIARRIVELHDGSILAQSAGAGCGATFTVHLPLSEDATSEASGLNPAVDEAEIRLQHAVTAATSEVTREVSERSAKRLEVIEGNHGTEYPPLRILLVEDDDGFARACQRLLSSHGHRVVRARGCAAVFVALQRESIDVIISDAHLRDGDAIQLLKGVRELLRRPTLEPLPAVAMSAFSSQQDATRYRAAGFAAQICKPFEESVLLRALQDAFRHGSLSTRLTK